MGVIQQVKVVNWPTPSPTFAPKPTPTPEWMYNIAVPHLDVGWGTFWVTVGALCIAIYAAIYAKSAFKTAQKDLRLSNANWEMINRAPKLEVSFDVEPPPAIVVSGCPRGNHNTYAEPNLKAIVWNTSEGKRRCDAFFIEAVVPAEALSLPERARLVTERFYGFVRKSAVEQQMLFPGGGAAVVKLPFKFDYAARAREFELSYRMKDDYNDYPAEGETSNGYRTVKIRLPIRPQFEFVNPRDEAEAEMMRILMAGHPPNDDSGWHDKYTHAFELLDAGGFKTPDERMKAAQEIANRMKNEPPPNPA